MPAVPDVFYKARPACPVAVLLPSAFRRCLGTYCTVVPRRTLLAPVQLHSSTSQQQRCCAPVLPLLPSAVEQLRYQGWPIPVSMALIASK